ncbi:ABC transporter permease [Curtobacterium flaccumfaciens pv. flaccumfaciens]|uniref:ABC transporter permease n=1 Tax=Curtobacterium flaccumfaciens TaxID=2035 RepID=UPI001BDE66CA|nr:ABC transporter permease [Curtobacterium flaccumfaciens]MBT1671028.1 ABC transporter permease [Curtobacterium flaccumfaciens pv. flaccumfaciens]
MVAQLLRLRADLLAGEVRGTARRSVAVVLASLVGLLAAVFVASQTIALGDVDPDVARAVIVPVGTLITFGFTVVPLVLGRSDQLDPRRFAVFGIERRRLAIGLVVAGLVGIPVIGVVVVTVGQVVAWARDPGLGLLAVLGGVLGVATCALLIRVCCTVGSRLIGPDRSRDAGWLVALVIIALSIPTVALLLRVDWLDPQGTEMQRVADVAGWTPWGAAWAVPAEVASGHVGAGVVKLLVAVAVVALLAWAWWALVGRALETVDDRARTRRYQGLGWFDRFGSAPVSAVAARALTYWARDPRYRTSYLIILLVPIVVIPLGVAGVPWQWTALVPLPLMALIAGFLPHNDVSYDNTAVWLHVASGAPGWSDRLGRVVPVLVVGAPAIVAGAALSAWLFGDWAAFPLLIGVSASALLSGLGLSSVLSVLMPYPTVRPGDHPFQQPQAAGVTATVAQATMVIGIVLCTVPAVGLAVLAAVQGPEPWSVLTLLVGIGVGAVVLVIGVSAGGRLFDRRGPDLLAAAQRN